MKRFCGMMPSDEIQREEHFKDKHELSLTIQAGEHGWTILYADGGTSFKDIDNTTDENFDIAYTWATNCLGTLTKR